VLGSVVGSGLVRLPVRISFRSCVRRLGRGARWGRGGGLVREVDFVVVASSVGGRRLVVGDDELDLAGPAPMRSAIRLRRSPGTITSSPGAADRSGETDVRYLGNLSHFDHLLSSAYLGEAHAPA
jgi:hypothetical protein